MEFMRIEPQPARGKLKDSLWDDPNYIVEIKYDGIREVSQFILDLIRFTGRRESVKGGLTERSANLMHLSGVGCPPHWKNPNVPGLDGTVLDGEIILAEEHIKRLRSQGVPVGGLSKAVGSIMNCLPPESLRKMEERGFLRYAAFDCLWFKNKDLRAYPLSERRKYIPEAIRAWNNPYAIAAAFAVDNKKAFLEQALVDGEEGIILKDLRAPYGKKTAWIKFKQVWTADCVVMGYEAASEMSIKKGDTEPTVTKYHANGWIGGIVVGQFKDGQLVQVTNPGHGVSGMDDALRAELSTNGAAYLGRVIKIKHNGREPTGKFRHPRYFEFRTDKAPQDCVLVWDEV
jgi:ATP-dependent DNA ligase